MKLLFICIYSIVLIGVPLFELLVKNYIRRKLKKKLPIYISDGNIKIHYARNYGMMLGFLSSSRKAVVVITSIMISLIVSISIYVIFFTEQNYILKIGLTLLSGGSFSNALERYIYKYVIDYFSFPNFFIKKIRKVIFNFADICIFIGIFLIFISIVIF